MKFFIRFVSIYLILFLFFHPVISIAAAADAGALSPEGRRMNVRVVRYGHLTPDQIENVVGAGLLKVSAVRLP